MKKFLILSIFLMTSLAFAQEVPQGCKEMANKLISMDPNTRKYWGFEGIQLDERTNLTRREAIARTDKVKAEINKLKLPKIFDTRDGRLSMIRNIDRSLPYCNIYSNPAALTKEEKTTIEDMITFIRQNRVDFDLKQRCADQIKIANIAAKYSYGTPDLSGNYMVFQFSKAFHNSLGKTLSRLQWSYHPINSFDFDQVQMSKENWSNSLVIYYKDKKPVAISVYSGGFIDTFELDPNSECQLVKKMSSGSNTSVQYNVEYCHEVKEYEKDIQHIQNMQYSFNLGDDFFGKATMLKEYALTPQNKELKEAHDLFMRDFKPDGAMALTRLSTYLSKSQQKFPDKNIIYHLITYNNFCNNFAKTNTGYYRSNKDIDEARKAKPE